MPRVVCLASSPAARARLRTALSRDHHLTVVDRWHELLGLLGEESVAGCIVDTDYRRRRIGLAELDRIRKAHPRLALVVYGSFEGRGAELFQLGQLGVDEIILAGRDDAPHQIRDTVSRALARALATGAEERLGNSMPDIGHRALRWAIEHAHEAPLVPDLADRLRTSRRTLSRRLRRAGLPPASEILLWGKLLRATRLLEDSDVTVERAAYCMGYSSGAALRRAFRRETGSPPTRVVERGGVLFVLDTFAREIERRNLRGPSRWGRAQPRKAGGASPMDPYA